MNVEVILLVAGGIVACVDQLQANGKSLLAWAVILIVIALLYGKLA